MRLLFVIGGSLFFLLHTSVDASTGFSKPCNPSLFPSSTQMANMGRCPIPSYPWAPPSMTVNASVFIDRGPPAVCHFPSKCPEASAVGHAYIIEDLPSLGHMMMSFTSLFSWLVGLTRAKGTIEVTAVWGSEVVPHHSSLTIRNDFFFPMLQTFVSFFSKHNSMRLRMLDILNHSRATCYQAKSCAVRHCLMGRITPSLAGASGHCASWFSSPSAVGIWRTMLRDQLEIPLPVHNCRSGKQKWARVLIYARPAGSTRAWKNPQRLGAAVHRYLSDHWEGEESLVQVHYHKEQTWAAQCHLFSHYDLIIGVHGAGLTNLICARPCAMIIEVGWTAYSFITILASHIGIHYCWTNVSVSGWNSDGNGISHPIFTSREIEPANLTTCLDRFVDVHRS